MKLGIDMHNVRDGGGVNYTNNLLRAFDPTRHGFDEIHVFGAEKTLSHLPDRAAVIKHSDPLLAGSLPRRLWFMRFRLDAELRKAGCDLLYCPGGLYFGHFRPYVTISRNMMPYEPEHWAMYPLFSTDRLRLALVRIAYTATFRRADGMIFLTDIARRVVGAAMGESRGDSQVIAHGVDHSRFNRAGRAMPPAAIDAQDVVRLIYPSRLEPYKHQVEVIRAVAQLRTNFPRLTLDLCGPPNPAYRALVEDEMRKLDPQHAWVRYLGEVPNAQLPELYERAHVLIFASSCENLPNTLIEAMAFGIPTVSSRRPPMPEVAGDACLYVDPADPDSIAQGIREALTDWPSSLERVDRGLARAAHHDWDLCADQTFEYLRSHVASQ